jgi:deoxyadenosine/deoxycytidine kinase
VPVVLDRTIYEDAEIFARNLARTRAMSKRDWDLYESLYKSVRQALRPPDVLIALTCSLRAAKQRIKTRGRPMEQSIPHAYLARLHRSYEEWFGRYDLSEIVVIDTTKLDYVEDMVALIDLTSRLDRVLR